MLASDAASAIRKLAFDLPLDQGADPVFTALLPVGTYDRLKFQIHKPSDANGDADLVAELRASNPEIRLERLEVLDGYMEPVAG